MKAKRMISILLTGSMLLSLLPVSALAAAPVFDAPAQTTAKKAAPLVQEADASRSTEEEAATRSSRDLDAENGTADSFTIQLNADGTPAGYGDGEHWYYSAASGCQLDTGVFALQPSSEPEAESALKARLFRIGDKAELVRGTVGCETNNYGTISGGTFQRMVYNYRAYDDQGPSPASSPVAPSKGMLSTGAPSPAAPSKEKRPTGAPSPAAPSKEKRPTGAPSPAGPLKRKCCS